MAGSSVRPINLVDFTGGLNLRADSFSLADNQSPDCENVELDPVGGFVARKGWTAVSDTALQGLAGPAVPSGKTWNPRSMFVHELSDGSDRVMLCIGNSGADVLGYRSADGGVNFAEHGVGGRCTPHGIDYAAWGDDLYMARGAGALNADYGTYKSNPILATTATLAQAETATFTAYTSPSTDKFPHAELICTHAGYMFAANLEEDGALKPNRLRWSHPNNPLAWMVDDRLDFLEGGGRITGLVSNGDHLLVFKTSSVYALFGYDSDSWSRVAVSNDKGAVHRQAIARSENAVYFYAQNDGIYQIANSSQPVEITENLRPMFKSTEFDRSKSNDIFLGWIDQKLWATFPYQMDGPNTQRMFVWDPTLSDGGAWTKFSSVSAVGPYAQGGHGGAGSFKLAAARLYPSVMDLEGNEDAIDTYDLDSLPDVVVGFPSWYTTSWQYANTPDLKKSWRRPTLIVKDRTDPYQLRVDVYRDYDETTVTRSKVLSVTPSIEPILWGSFVWGDGTIYSAGAKGSKLLKGFNFGSARAIQAKVVGQSERRWGVDAIILKFIPRRMR